MTEVYRRHDLLDVDPEAWAAVLARRPDLDGVPHLADWARRQHPVIVRRRHLDDASGLVPVGLPLPPENGKRRISLVLPVAKVRPRAPVTLCQAVSVWPSAWSETLADLVDLGSRHGLVPHLFGGLLWQTLTGLRYLSETSDLDLLWPGRGAIARDLLDGLAAVEVRAPMRLDGEVLLPDGGGVNWRELHAAKPNDAVLVKHLDRLTLREAKSLLAGDPE